MSSNSNDYFQGNDAESGNIGSKNWQDTVFVMQIDLNSLIFM